MKARSTIFALALAWSVAAQRGLAEPPATEGVPAAPAAPPTKARVAEAQRAFARGRAAMDGGDYAAAIAEFRRALEIKDTPGLHFFVAHCLEEQGRLIQAADEYDRAEALLSTYPAPDVEGLLPEARSRLERETPQLTVERLTPGAIVELDGESTATSRPLRLDPGPHSISIQAAGYEPVEREFTLARQERLAISGTLRPFPEVKVAAPAREAEAPTSSLRPAAFWTASGVAVAGLGIGIAGAIWHASADASVREQGAAVDRQSGADPSACNGSSAPSACASLDDALSDRSAANKMEVAGFATAAGGAVVAGLVYFLWPDAVVGLDATPTAGASGVEVHWSGQF